MLHQEITRPLPRHTPVTFFNSTTHLAIGEGYVDLYVPGSDSYTVHEIVGGSTHIHVAPAANVRERAAR